MHTNFRTHPRRTRPLHYYINHICFDAFLAQHVSPTMNRLLAELHLFIISYLTPQDYPNYRLISTRCVDVGASLIFSSLNFTASTHNIHRAHHMANTPNNDLARHVKSLHYNGEPYRGTCISVLGSIIETLVHAGAPLSSLTTTCLPYYFFTPEHFRDAFTRCCMDLTHLALDIRWYVSEVHTFDAVIRSGTLRNLLTALVRLESLSLRFGPENSMKRGRAGHVATMYTGPRPRLRDVMPLHRNWPKLQKLDMWFVSATVDELLGLLRQYAATVNELDLAGIAICRRDGRRELDNRRLGLAWRSVVEALEGFEYLRRACLRERTRNTAVGTWDWWMRGCVLVETDIGRYLAHSV